MPVASPCCCCRAPPSLLKKRLLLLVAGSLSLSSALSRNPLLPASRSLFVCSVADSSASSSSLIVGSSPWRFPGFGYLRRMEHLIARASVSKNSQLIEHLQQYGIIKSNKVAEVMETVDRGLFAPDGSAAYIDSPMPIGYNATISAPHMHALCLELLKDHLQPGMRALDIGSGTGYLTACFALMVGRQGRSVGVEHVPHLVSASIENVRKSAAADLMYSGCLSLHIADGRNGWAAEAPYDAIHVGAAAAEVPEALVQQLKPGGRMVIPVGELFQDLKVVDKKPDGSLQVHTETSVRYVPLTSHERQMKGF